MGCVCHRYVAAVELLGERDESLEELKADLMDVKQLYREQIEYMALQLTQFMHTHQGHGQGQGQHQAAQTPGQQG